LVSTLRWLEQKLYLNLPANAVIIMDNTSYHNIQIDKPPSIVIRKDIMKKCLHSHGIHYTEDATKIRLFKIIKLNEFTVDYILA
jgi:hypothetical protein